MTNNENNKKNEGANNEIHILSVKNRLYYQSVCDPVTPHSTNVFED